MVARQTRLVTALALAFAVLVSSWSTYGQTPGRPRPSRIVSLVPALTEMLFDIGAGSQVVGVSRYDTFPIEVRSLTKVGGLLDPNYEAILRLDPDLVLTYGSQTELERRLTAGGVRFYSYRHAGLTSLFKTMAELGTAIGREPEARAASDRLQTRLDEIRRRVAGLSRPKTLLVFGRERGALRQIFASGGIGFEHEVLELAGGRNIFADTRRESVQPSIEMLLAGAPEVIVELRAAAAPDAATIKNDHEVWGRLASVPAVRNGRVHVLYGEHLSIPGPRLGIAAEEIARAIHPEAFR